MNNPTNTKSNNTRASNTMAAPQVAVKPYLALPQRSAPFPSAANTLASALGQAAPPTTPYNVTGQTAGESAVGSESKKSGDGSKIYVRGPTPAWSLDPESDVANQDLATFLQTQEAAESDSDYYDFLNELFGDSNDEDGEGCAANSLQRCKAVDCLTEVTQTESGLTATPDARLTGLHLLSATPNVTSTMGQKQSRPQLTLPSGPTPQPCRLTYRRASPALLSEIMPGENRSQVNQSRARATTPAAASQAQQPQEPVITDRPTPVVVQPRSAPPITRQTKGPQRATQCTRVEAPTSWCACAECGTQHPPLIVSPSPMRPLFWPHGVPPWLAVAFRHSERLKAGQELARRSQPIASTSTLPSQVGSLAPSKKKGAKKAADKPRERQAEPSTVKRARSAAKEQTLVAAEQKQDATQQTRTAKEEEKARMKQEKQEVIAAGRRAENMRKVNGSEMTAKFRNPRGYSWLKPATQTSRPMATLPPASTAANIAAASSHAESNEGLQSAGKRKREGQDNNNAEGSENKRRKRKA
ncbi:hypothetical protein BKA62DRAFT_670303 [Auriculariales sp. MPI-PUGE-AT-0066]|nr:hypothetical protein BKA62DRAFT_670303 [Auriculariales sp. MPI-PUGE-AT-0066]